MRVEAASDSALFIGFADSISLETHRRVVALFHPVEGLRDRYPGIRNVHPAYSSLLIDFDPLQLTHEQLESLVAPLIVESVPSNLRRSGLIEIPVCYDREFAPDLATVAQHSSLTEEQVIATHAEGDYFVYFLGFSPGFAYLGGLARYANPRSEEHTSELQSH